jgi:hypothetical protein
MGRPNNDKETMKLLTCISLLGLAMAATAQNIPRFLPPVSYSVPGATMATLADINGDGLLDIITANGYAPDGVNPGAGGHGVSVLLGVINGTFQPAKTVLATGNPSYVAVTDFNGDGKPDILVDNGPGTNTVSVLFGNGNGTFQPPVDTAITNLQVISWQSIHRDGTLAVADFNGDGKPDFAVTFATQQVVNASALITPTAEVFINNGNGTFTQTYEADNFDAVATGDFDKDGKADLLLFNGLDSVKYGNGDGTFRDGPFEFLTGLANSFEAVIGDFNQDGIPDVISEGFGIGRAPALPFLNASLGLGGTSFNTITSNFALTNGSNLVVADFNNDGKLDIAGSSTVYCGAGNGLFATATDSLAFAAGNTTTLVGGFFPSQWVAAGDLDRNGSTDLVATEDGKFVKVSLNTSGTPPLLASVSTNANFLVGGGTVTGKVSIGGPAPAGGALVTLSTSDASATIIGGTTVTIPAGSNTASFKIATSVVVASDYETVSASYHQIMLKAHFTLVPKFALSTIAGSTPSIVGMFGGNPGTAVVTLSGPASDGVVVTLTSSNPAILAVPANVTVAAGATTASLPITAKFVPADTAVTVSASFQGVTRTGVITVKKEAATLTVTKAEYAVKKSQLTLEVASTDRVGSVQVYNPTTGALIGSIPLVNVGKFSGQIVVTGSLTSIAVQSSVGGLTIASVAQK